MPSRVSYSKLEEEPIQYGKVLLAGAGFLADAYDLFVMNLVLECINTVHKLGDSDKSMIASTALWGSVCGQLFFGSMADKFGRRVIFITTVILISVGAIGSSLVQPSSKFSIFQQIALFRFILGFGVGGEYPLSATVTAESASAAVKGRMMATVFAMQGIGSLLSSILIWLCIVSGRSPEFTWRFALAFGAAPGLLAFYWRWKMEETESFAAHQKEAQENDKSHCSLMLGTIEKYKWHLLGTGMNWLVFDVVFYANGLFNSDVTAILSKKTTGLTLQEKSVNAMIITLLGIPGYWISVFSMETIGRKNIQMLGLTMMGILFLVLGHWYTSLKDHGALFLIIYGMTFLFSNFGPNATTYIIPGEIYPTNARATCHGISAASGKLGAAFGTYFFPTIKKRKGIAFVVTLCGVLAWFCLAVTVFLTPRYTAEDLDNHRPIKLPLCGSDLENRPGDSNHPADSIEGGMQ